MMVDTNIEFEHCATMDMRRIYMYGKLIPFAISHEKRRTIILWGVNIKINA